MPVLCAKRRLLVAPQGWAIVNITVVVVWVCVCVCVGGGGVWEGKKCVNASCNKIVPVINRSIDSVNLAQHTR